MSYNRGRSLGVEMMRKKFLASLAEVSKLELVGKVETSGASSY